MYVVCVCVCVCCVCMSTHNPLPISPRVQEELQAQRDVMVPREARVQLVVWVRLVPVDHRGQMVPQERWVCPGLLEREERM